ncbi:MAG: hypothetical protein ACFB6R_08705 [Alphaproteobacteria bacterium]
MVWLFEIFLIGHIVAGAFGLLVFWLPVLSRKGGRLHRRWGRYFTYSMLITGTLAAGMGLTTLVEPMATHPHVDDPDIANPATIRGLFGWMMVYLAILTVSLAWHAIETIRHKKTRARTATPFAVGLQFVVMGLAANCAVQGLLLGQPIMVGISAVGLASGPLNLYYMWRAAPPAHSYLMEHVRTGIGAGVSVYTAFLAFGAVRLMPSEAFNPVMWAVPTVLGISLILYHFRKIILASRTGRAAAV